MWAWICFTRMAEVIRQRRQLVLAEPEAVGIPDGDLDAGASIRPVVIQHIQSG